MSASDKSFIAFALASLLATLAMLSYGWTLIAESDRIAVAKQRAIMANYRSPIERTDAQRLDWLTSHPKETPWTTHGTDPRHEIDFAMDREAEDQK